ncbi:MAG: glycosyltransferase family 2 protein [Acidipropionibacterium sp.]|jgi:GT2 family glycosyltransferase|nr:glycosyltransferase family 2 protein [Acidipropionibacterium sp.]
MRTSEVEDAMQGDQENMSDDAGLTPSLQVDVIVVAYNCAEMVSNCVAPFVDLHMPDANFNVYVADNDSSDDVIERLTGLDQQVHPIEIGWNSGFGHANNVALGQSDAPWVLLLNPDAAVTPETILSLIERYTDRSDVGIIGCRLVRSDGSLDEAAKRSFPNPRLAFEYLFMGKKKSAGYHSTGVDDFDEGVVDAVNGAFMLIRRTALEAVGGFDEDFWMYGEDLDLCKRIAEAGWKTFYDGSFEAMHLKSAVSGEHRSPKLNWHFHRSMWLYYKKHFPGDPPLLKGAVFTGVVGRLGCKIVVDSTIRGARALRQHRRDRRDSASSLTTN